MPFFDVLFPVNLDPLTYECPEDLLPKAEPGRIVSAPLKNVVTRGILLGRSDAPVIGRIKKIAAISEHPAVLNDPALKLLRWMSEYYVAPMGIVLKYTVPAEIFSDKPPRKRRRVRAQADVNPLPAIDPAGMALVAKSISEGKYRAFLVHAPASAYEYSMVYGLLRNSENVIVVVPETSHADFLYEALEPELQARSCLIHGQVPKGRKLEYIEGIISGKYNVVIGTRPALFAPLKTVSLIAVLHEHSDAYKIEEGFVYHVRDVAVMRGFIEKCTVILSSPTPAVSSYFNSWSGKYNLIRPASEESKTKIRILNMRYERKIRPDISKTVYDSAARIAGKGKQVLFLVNRRGYSILHCGECGKIESCPSCRIPLVLHGAEKRLKCHYCGAGRQIPQKCGRCGSFSLERLGSGTEKVQEEIGELLSIPTLRFDSDSMKSKSEIREAVKALSDGSIKALVGTKMITKYFRGPHFGMVAVLNTEAMMNFPDFRAAEKAYMELSGLLELVEPGGELIVQTRSPQESIFRYLKARDYPALVKEELALRKSLSYPPFSKMIQIKLRGGFEKVEKTGDLLKSMDDRMEVLGPAPVRTDKGHDEFAFLLRSKNSNLLKEAARAVIRQWRKSPGVKILLDVDP